MRAKTAEDFRLLELLDPAARAAGFEIVRLRLMGGDRQRRLQVMAEGPGGTLGVDNCARLSRALSYVLDAVDPIRGGYLLEVSSPGVDRPLTRLEDFSAFAGLEAKIELQRPIEGQKRFRGQIAGLDGDTVLLKPGPGLVRLPFVDIAEAKLVLTDALLERGARERAARQASSQASPDNPARTLH
ncbi:MAG TPA: ribosome maturation factor RimP [Caulobacteraceae bacterium]|nr:ribosome maturation factor RimP [Caulobacteraceae bacterium]